MSEPSGNCEFQVSALERPAFCTCFSTWVYDQPVVERDVGLPQLGRVDPDGLDVRLGLQPGVVPHPTKPTHQTPGFPSLIATKCSFPHYHSSLLRMPSAVRSKQIGATPNLTSTGFPSSLMGRTSLSYSSNSEWKSRSSCWPPLDVCGADRQPGGTRLTHTASLSHSKFQAKSTDSTNYQRQYQVLVDKSAVNPAFCFSCNG